MEILKRQFLEQIYHEQELDKLLEKYSLDYIYEYSKPIQVCVKEIKNIMDVDDVLVESPDGFVPVLEYVDKGTGHEEFITTSEVGEIRTNGNHLLETIDGWKSVKNILDGELVLTHRGYKPVKVVKTGNLIDIVDIVIGHENHRYWADGYSSHNTNVGKSSLMCFLASEYVRRGKNVLYISMEMAEEVVYERVEANLYGVTTNDLKKLTREQYLSNVMKLKKKTHGELIVKEYPTSGAHVGHFRHLLKELEQKKKFRPDIIFVDYINICASSRYTSMSGVNSYSYVKAIAEELRGLAVEFDVPLFSATQTNRGAANESNPDLTATSESIGLPQTADFMFAITTDEVLQDNGQQLLHLLKTRWGNKSKIRPQLVNVNFDLMRYSDVGEVNTQVTRSDEVKSKVGQRKPQTNEIDWG